MQGKEFTSDLGLVRWACFCTNDHLLKCFSEEHSRFFTWYVSYSTHILDRKWCLGFFFFFLVCGFFTLACVAPSSSSLSSPSKPQALISSLCNFPLNGRMEWKKRKCGASSLFLWPCYCCRKRAK